MGQLEPVHRPGHLDIGEDDLDVRPTLQNGDCLVGIRRFEDLKTRGHDSCRLNP